MERGTRCNRLGVGKGWLGYYGGEVGSGSDWVEAVVADGEGRREELQGEEG